MRARPASTPRSCTAAKILPIARIPDEQREVAAGPGRTTAAADGYDPLTRFLELFEGVTTASTREARAAELAGLPVAERLQRRIVDGERKGLEADLDEALLTRPGAGRSSTTTCSPA